MDPLTKAQLKKYEEARMCHIVLNHLMEEIQKLETIATIQVAIEGLLK